MTKEIKVRIFMIRLYRDRDQGGLEKKNDKNRLYIPPKSHYNTSNNSGKILMEDMMANLFKGV